MTGRVARLAAQFASIYATSWPARSVEERAALIDSFLLDLVISGQITHADADDLRTLRFRIGDELATRHAMASPHARSVAPAVEAAQAAQTEVTEEQIRQLNPETLATMIAAGRAWLTADQFRTLVAALREGGRVVAGRRRLADGREESIHAAAILALTRRGYLNREVTSYGGCAGTLSDRTRAAVGAMWLDWSNRRTDRMSWRSMSDREVVVLRPDGGPYVRIMAEMASDKELARAADAVVAGITSRAPA
jgi:hypothetical protein